ncbi:MAG: AGE family epimerase/isomerase [Chitinophagaceae bacterium]
MSFTLNDFRQEVKQELFNIADYWIAHSIDKEKGGFYGKVDGRNKPDIDAPRAIVITSRILWTFSAIQQLFPDPRYVMMAKRAFDYLLEHFIDKEFRGVYWSVTAEGKPLEQKKQLYGHAFAIYGLSEYYKISEDEKALNAAKDIFSAVVHHAYDKNRGGYIEAFTRDWKDTDDYILCKGESRKSMNTHIHLLEAFTNFYKVWKDESSRFHLEHCIHLMLDHIIDPLTNRMTLFFKEDWTHTSDTISYGHDIEASWLLWEAAEVLGDIKIKARCKDASLKMAKAAIDGLAANGAISYEYDPSTKHLDESKQWWPEAEAMVGFYNAYQLSGKVHFLEKSEKVWSFIKDHLIDHKNGEWFSGVDANNKVIADDKINFWKGPYHNSRACMEIWKRLGEK